MSDMPTMTEKILKAHCIEGVMERGTPIAIRIDQTLTQDATGTMAYLQLEAMGVDQVKTELSVSYVDHNTLKMPMIINIYRRSLPSMGFIFPEPVTVFVIKYI